MVDHISIENGEAVLVLRFYDDVKVPMAANFSILTSSMMDGLSKSLVDIRIGDTCVRG